MSRHRHTTSRLTIDPETRARMLDRARSVAEDLTVVLNERLERLPTHPVLRIVDGMEEAREHMAQAIALTAQAAALTALARAALLKLDTPGEKTIINVIAQDLLKEITSD